MTPRPSSPTGACGDGESCFAGSQVVCQSCPTAVARATAARARALARRVFFGAVAQRAYATLDGRGLDAPAARCRRLGAQRLHRDACGRIPCALARLAMRAPGMTRAPPSAPRRHASRAPPHTDALRYARRADGLCIGHGADAPPLACIRHDAATSILCIFSRHGAPPCRFSLLPKLWCIPLDSNDLAFRHRPLHTDLI